MGCGDSCGHLTPVVLMRCGDLIDLLMGCGDLMGLIGGGDVMGCGDRTGSSDQVAAVDLSLGSLDPCRYLSGQSRPIIGQI